MPVTTSTTLTNQFQTYFSKELLTLVQQETILDQFAMKNPIPKNQGYAGASQKLAMFRFGPPSISGVQSLGEGTAIASANYRALALNKLEKGLTQYGQVIGLTDILRATDLFIIDGKHVGFVNALNKDGTFQTIEGNAANGVRSYTRSWSDGWQVIRDMQFDEAYLCADIIELRWRYSDYKDMHEELEELIRWCGPDSTRAAVKMLNEKFPRKTGTEDWEITWLDL